MGDITKGVKTSEFWVTVGVQIVGILVLFGFISAADKAAGEAAVVNGVEHAFALLTMAGAAWKYVASRTAVKTGSL